MRKLALFILPFLFFACSNDDELETNYQSTNKSETEIVSEGEIVLGKKVPNPYSVSNMRKALQELESIGVDVSGFTINTSDLYVRFLPKDTIELEKLYSYKDVEFFDHPLDYEIAKEGSYYQDPGLPKDGYTWLYTTVPADFEFPNIQYEILEECFIPKDDSPAMQIALEETSFKIVGLSNLLEEETTKWISYVYPKGTLKVYNTNNGTYEPLKGVKVVGHIIVKVASGYTNENGFYTLNKKFCTNLSYSIWYENMKGFTIRYPIICAFHSMGVHNKAGYSKNIPSGSINWGLSTINNAAYDYYKMCSLNGIYTPPSNLKMHLINGYSGSSAPMLPRVWHPVGINSNSGWSNFFSNIFIGLSATFINNTILKLIGPDITIGYVQNTASSKSLYNTTNHELAHASHFRKVGSEYWAKYISYIITYGAYGSITSNNSGICGVGEMWGYSIGNIQTMNKYLTNENHGYSWWFKMNILQDLIAGNHLTIKQVYDCLTSDVRSHADLKQKMISRHPDKQDVINIIFRQYGF